MKQNNSPTISIRLFLALLLGVILVLIGLILLLYFEVVHTRKITQSFEMGYRSEHAGRIQALEPDGWWLLAQEARGVIRLNHSDSLGWRVEYEDGEHVYARSGHLAEIVKRTSEEVSFKEYSVRISDHTAWYKPEKALDILADKISIGSKLNILVNYYIPGSRNFEKLAVENWAQSLAKKYETKWQVSKNMNRLQEPFDELRLRKLYEQKNTNEFFHLYGAHTDNNVPRFSDNWHRFADLLVMEPNQKTYIYISSLKQKIGNSDLKSIKTRILINFFQFILFRSAAGQSAQSLSKPNKLRFDSP